MKILYFAFLRQRTGLGEETVEPPTGVHTVAGLVEWLKTRGPGYAEALRDVTAIRIAVNHEFADLDTAIAANDEVAFFPPVTGG